MGAVVKDLIPGQCVGTGERSAVFIARCVHPVARYAAVGLYLVVWRLDTGEVSLDALAPQQDIGYVLPGDPATQLAAAIRGPA